MAIAVLLFCIFCIAMVFRDGLKRNQYPGNFLITDGATFQRIEHSQADADAWAALGYTVTKLH